MLEDSLGGNCRTTMLAMVSPALEAIMETISTLKFANRAKNIRNEARVNEDLDQKSLLRKYERELKVLRAELEAKSKNVVDKRKLLELEEQKRRAEADRMTAIKALEARSVEFMKEKEEKKKLEQRIAILMGQMSGGDNGSLLTLQRAGLDVSVAQDLVLKQQQEKLRQEYERKLADIEKERETIEEEKAQVDRYKQLLLKQRDIMIALTQRLVERDEQIMALQDELDAYDVHQKELEEKLDEKTALLIKYQRIYIESSEKSSDKLKEDVDWTLATTDSKNDEIFNSSRAEPVEVSEEDTGEVEYDNIQPPSLKKPVVVASEVKKAVDVDRRFHVESFLEKELKLAYNSKPAAFSAGAGVDLAEGQRLATISVLKKLLSIAKQEDPTVDYSAAAVAAGRISPVDDSREKVKLEQNLKAWQSHCEALTKERNAMQSIMETKVAMLVDKVSSSVSDILRSSAPRDPRATQMLQKVTVSLDDAYFLIKY
jgi:hypothetical protein